MKSYALPVAAAVLSLAVAEHAQAQSGYRLLATAGARPPVTTPRAAKGPGPRLTSQITEEEGGAYAAGEMQSGGYVAGGGTMAGSAYGGGGYGYAPDFGFAADGMSVWPGVPACCDPWFGYCGEPRHNHCSCGRGTYQYFRCNKDNCQPELVSWGGKCSGDCKSGGCRSCGSCSTCTSCASCSSGTYSSPQVSTPQSETTRPLPAVDAAPKTPAVTRQPSVTPPRNKLPKNPPAPSALGKTDLGRG